MKTLFVLGCNKLNLPALSEINKMKDVKLVILDGNPLSPSRKITNFFECVDIKDISAVFQLAKKYKINGIFSINEYGVRSASYVSSSLGLIGINMATANAVLDKGTMREVWNAYNILQPKFQIVSEKKHIKKFIDIVGFPVVLKPIESCAARGINKISSYENIDIAFEEAIKFNSRMIIEKFIDGVESSVEVIRYNGVTNILAYSDKNKRTPTIAEEICYPGNFSSNIVSRIKNISSELMSSMGIYNGIAHIEFIITDNNIYTLELAARPGGGHTFHPITSHVSGINYPQIVANLYLGNKVNLNILEYGGACYNFLYTNENSIFGKSSDQEIQTENIIINFFKDLGNCAVPPKNSMDRLGCVVALSDTRNKAVSLSREFKNKLGY